MTNRLLDQLIFNRSFFYFIGVVLIIAIVGYGLFEARKLLEGPQISIASPKDGSAVGGPLVHIEGTVANVAFFSVDGVQAFADPSGHFDVAIAPPTGYADVEVAAVDRFGKHTDKIISLNVLDYCTPTG